MFPSTWTVDLHIYCRYPVVQGMTSSVPSSMDLARLVAIEQNTHESLQPRSDSTNGLSG